MMSGSPKQTQEPPVPITDSISAAAMLVTIFIVSFE
jgi:hypothetical protein